MSNPCEWCVKTSEQIDSIEYENEQLRERLKILENRVLSISRFKDDANREENLLHSEVLRNRREPI